MALRLHHNIARAVAQLSGGKEIRLWHDQIQYKPKGKGGVNMWHQDWPYWKILSAPHQITAWVALDEVDAENGCMSMVPGSHLWGDQIDFLHRLPSFDAMPHKFDGHDIEVKLCPVRKGQVHFHHAMTWHGSHANTSQRPRRALGRWKSLRRWLAFLLMRLHRCIYDWRVKLPVQLG
jgi:ectoine hydroxylase-related dioxygenase (phytanoyl-CoA dioxygenase family)